MKKCNLCLKADKVHYRVRSAIHPKWLNSCKKKHKDNIHSLRYLFSLDNCQIIKKIDNWEIELFLEDNLVEETNYPDWYGYKKIDNIQKV